MEMQRHATSDHVSHFTCIFWFSFSSGKLNNQSKQSACIFVHICLVCHYGYVFNVGFVDFFLIGVSLQAGNQGYITAASPLKGYKCLK